MKTNNITPAEQTALNAAANTLIRARMVADGWKVGRNFATPKKSGFVARLCNLDNALKKG